MKWAGRHVTRKTKKKKKERKGGMKGGSISPQVMKPSDAKIQKKRIGKPKKKKSRVVLAQRGGRTVLSTKQAREPSVGTQKGGNDRKGGGEDRSFAQVARSYRKGGPTQKEEIGAKANRRRKHKRRG